MSSTSNRDDQFFFQIMEKYSETPTHEKLNTPVITQKKTDISGTKSEPVTEKAKEIMLVASKSSSQNHSPIVVTLAPPSMVQSPAESAINVPVAALVSKVLPTLVHNPHHHSIASDLCNV